MKRAAFFIDGYNLYHSLKRLKKPHIKWLNLHNLAKDIIPPQTETLQKVHYFSALAEWLPQQKIRHESYIKALKHYNVEIILGKFKKKDKKCPLCGGAYTGHEEKETDVNIALTILNEAYKDNYDCAYIISRDSDLKPALAMVKQIFSKKEIIIVAPPHAGHSTDLLSVADRKQKINMRQIQASLLPEIIKNKAGKIIAKRPSPYAPPPPPIAPLQDSSIIL